VDKHTIGWAWVTLSVGLMVVNFIIAPPWRRDLITYVMPFRFGLFSVVGLIISVGLLTFRRAGIWPGAIALVIFLILFVLNLHAWVQETASV